jgi:hypothetical protein
MATKKKAKKEKALWVGLARNIDYDGKENVLFFTSKPKPSTELCCDCGQPMANSLEGNRVDGTLGEEGMCQDGFTKITGIKLKAGIPVQIKVVVV